MLEKVIVVTNNVLSKEYFEDICEVVLIEGTLMEVLLKVRDYIHRGHRLLSHPLMGSIKPNQTPFKTVVISQKRSLETDFDSLMYIEKSIEMTENLLRHKPLRDWPEKVLEDYRLIDLDLIKSGF